MRLDAKCREIQQYGQQENKYVNRAYRRSGTLWEGRFARASNAKNLNKLALNPARLIRTWPC